RRGRLVRRGLLHVQRGGRLDDALPPCRLEGALLPGRRGRPRRRRVARRPALRREPTRPPALVRKAPRPARRRTRAPPAAGLAATARRRPAPRAPSGGRALPAVGQGPRSPHEDQVIVYLRLAFGTLFVLAPGWAVARAFGQRGAAVVLAWTLASV